MPLLQLRGIRKAYPGVQALGGVDLDVEAGEVHALLGENGAGKSTLMKVVAGSVVPDEGTMTLDGTPVPFDSPHAMRDRGIGIVYQELSLVPALSVAENVLLGRLPVNRFGVVRARAIPGAAQPHLRRIGLEVAPDTRTDTLGTAERQLVEIAKALSSEVKVLLLDEPTSALSDPESRRLFDVIRDLRDSGVAVVYVSHRLPEVLAIADHVTVLRDGTKVDTVAAAGIDEDRLAAMMVGRAVSLAAHPAARSAPPVPADDNGRAVALRACGLARPPRLKPVDLTLYRGEIVAVFGLVGAGRTRLARSLFGLEPATEGHLEIGGRRVRHDSPAEAIANGLGLVGEDRSAGLVPRLSVACNITLASLPRVSRGPLLDGGRERALAQDYAQELGVRVPTVDHLVDTLSGGNAQKVLLARWLCSQARVLLLDDPLRGIDVGAKEEVFRLLRDLARSGAAVLYLTSEIREAQALAHRILVMSNGRLVSSLQPDAPEEELMAAAGGLHG